MHSLLKLGATVVAEISIHSVNTFVKSKNNIWTAWQCWKWLSMQCTFFHEKAFNSIPMPCPTNFMYILTCTWQWWRARTINCTFRRCIFWKQCKSVQVKGAEAFLELLYQGGVLINSYPPRNMPRSQIRRSDMLNNFSHYYLKCTTHSSSLVQTTHKLVVQQISIASDKAGRTNVIQ